MRYKSRTLIILLVLISALLSTSCSRGAAPPDRETLEYLGFRVIPESGDFPDIRFMDMEGGDRRLSDFEGSVVLLNFWASWCPPCRAEMPAMERLAEKLSNGDFAMIPVNVQEPADLVKTFIKEFDIGFPVYLDEDAEAARDVGVSGLPTSILIDRNGDAVAVVTGAIEWDSPEIIEMMSIWTR